MPKNETKNNVIYIIGIILSTVYVEISCKKCELEKKTWLNKKYGAFVHLITPRSEKFKSWQSKIDHEWWWRFFLEAETVY